MLLMVMIMREPVAAATEQVRRPPRRVGKTTTTRRCPRLPTITALLFVSTILLLQPCLVDSSSSSAVRRLRRHSNRPYMIVIDDEEDKQQHPSDAVVEEDVDEMERDLLQHLLMGRMERESSFQMHELEPTPSPTKALYVVPDEQPSIGSTQTTDAPTFTPPNSNNNSGSKTDEENDPHVNDGPDEKDVGDDNAQYPSPSLTGFPTFTPAPAVGSSSNNNGSGGGSNNHNGEPKEENTTIDPEPSVAPTSVTEPNELPDDADTSDGAGGEPGTTTGTDQPTFVPTPSPSIAAEVEDDADNEPNSDSTTNGDDNNTNNEPTDNNEASAPTSAPTFVAGADGDDGREPTGGENFPTADAPSTPTASEPSVPTADSPPSSGGGSNSNNAPTVDESTPEGDGPTTGDQGSANDPTVADEVDSGTSEPTSSPSSSTSSPVVFDLQTLQRSGDVLMKCGVTLEQRTNMFSDIVANLSPSRSSDTTVVVDRVRSQYEALTWLDEEDERLLCPQDIQAVEQRYTAALFYFSLDGGGWTTSTRWLDELHECEWYGLSCNNTFPSISKITLPSNNLAGELPVEMFTTLTNLTGISLGHNKNIGGYIPEEVSALSKLEYIDLDDNALSGSLPDVLYSMTSLQAIDVNNNEFSGPLSDDIGSLVNLVVLQLENNAFTGDVPATGLTNIPGLTLVSLQGNDFTGSFKPLCETVETRRDDYPGFLQFFLSDCAGSNPQVDCTCCSTCLE